jgi:hypothetical protein
MGETEIGVYGAFPCDGIRYNSDLVGNNPDIVNESVKAASQWWE